MATLIEVHPKSIEIRHDSGRITPRREPRAGSKGFLCTALPTEELSFLTPPTSH